MDSNTNQSSTVTKIVIAIVAILLCCACIVIAGAGYILYQASQNIPTDLPLPIPTSVETESPSSPAPTPERPPVDSIPTGTLETLNQTIVPENDPSDLACRLKKICNIPATLEPRATPYVLGDKQIFWASDVDTNANFKVNATLQYVSPHVYFWVEDGVKYNAEDLKALADAFENKIYPTDREFFGSEWSPGIDGDVHIYILYARGLGNSIAGYFSGADEQNPLAHEYSNAHEMFDFNADNTNLGENFTYGVLAHEFQHMIHFAQDRNETSWINEGFSEVAAFLNGYDVGGFDQLYVSNPDLQLNDWPNDPNATSPHYGAGFLYLTYFLDRFGEDATKAVVKNPENGLTSIDDTLKTLNITDPETGKVITADDVFMDWAATLNLMDKSVGDGRYYYHNYPSAPTISPAHISNCPDTINDSVNQYGIDAYGIDCSGDHTIHFSGATVAGLFPEDAHSGKYAFWSNKGDESDMTLTHEFDFSSVSGPIEFNYWTWYDLEKDYDYLYLEASIDDGKSWQFIETPSGRSKDQDPSGNAYGWGYNAKSSGWIQEKVDLSNFAGQKVQLRFEYVTDAAVNGEGLLVDDVHIDAINYQSDFETDDGGWVANGFARVENVLPQTFRLSLILKGDTTTVTNIQVNPDQTADIPLSLKAGDEAILIVTGTTRFTRLPAAYQIEVK